MKKFLKFCLMAVVIVSSAFLIYKVTDKYNISILKEGLECNIITKGVNNSKGLALGENGYMYIAFKEYIKEIDRDGKERVIYKDNNIDIEDMLYKDGALFFITDSRIVKLDLVDLRTKDVIENLPLGGNGIDRKLLVSNGEVYLSLGSVTNSGISEDERYDLTPVDMVLKGENINGTSPFKGSGEKCEEGDVIKKSPIGNGTVYKINLDNGALSLYAYGIRGITGMSCNSEGKLMAIFSGMENIGVRPINRDMDYIYEVLENEWYGFPDFSGGDNISSPRFKASDINKQLLSVYPKQATLGPKYQHSAVGTLRELAIDTNGLIFDKDTLVVWDKGEGVISTIDNSNIYKKVLKLNEDSYVEDIMYNGDEILVLDSGIGCIYNIKAKEGILGFTLPIIVWVFVFTLCLSILMIIIYKMNKKPKNI